MNFAKFFRIPFLERFSVSASVEHIVRNFKKESGISERMFTEKLDFNEHITQKNCKSKKIIGDSVMNQITNGLDV